MPEIYRRVTREEEEEEEEEEEDEGWVMTRDFSGSQRWGAPMGKREVENAKLRLVHATQNRNYDPIH